MEDPESTREPSQGPEEAQQGRSSPAPGEPIPGEPDQEQAPPVGTSFRRNVWLLVIVIGVVVFAWVLSVLWKRVPEQMAELQQPAPRQPELPPRRPAPPPPRPAPALVSKVVGSGAEIIAASPALALESGGPAYRLPRVFDVTKRLPGLETSRLIRMPSQWADQRGVLNIKDIPDAPFLNAQSLEALAPEDLVVAVSVGDETKGYPFKSLSSFAAIRDTVGGIPVFVCLSAWTQTARCLVPRAEAGDIEWHDAGLFYRGQDVFYDTATGSLWDSLTGQALTGPAAGQSARVVPAPVAPWDQFRAQHPDAPVLTVNVKLEGTAAERRRIGEQALFAYLQSPAVPFDLVSFDPAATPLPAKEFVLGLALADEATAYPLGSLSRAGVDVLTDEVGGREVEVHVSSDHTGYATSEGSVVDAPVMLWFAWKEANPGTDLYVVPGQPAAGPPPGAPSAANP